MSAPALHSRIGAEIEARIMSGAWPPGHRVPAEHELMAEYGCARMTVSKALSGLAARGLIERRRRAGSFVAAPPRQHAALAIPDIRADILAQHRRYRLALLARRARAPNAADRARLRMARGAVLDLRCLHFADDAPYALELRLINLNRVPAAASADFSIEPPGSWLLDHVPWTEAEHNIAAIAADGSVAAALGLARGSACLQLDRWTWNQAGSDSLPECLTWARQIFPGQALTLSAHFSARAGGAPALRPSVARAAS